MAVIGFSGHQEIRVVAHEPSHVGSAQFDRQTQKGELLIFGHGELRWHGSNVSGNPATAFNRRPEKAYSGIRPAWPVSIFPQVENPPGHTKQALKMRNPTSSVLAHLVGLEIHAGLRKKFTPKSQARKISANPPRSNRGVRYSKTSQPPKGFDPLEVHRKPLKATWHKG